MDRPKVGDAMIVYEAHLDKRKARANGQPARVMKVGRTKFTLRREGSSHNEEFYLETRRSADGLGRGWAETPERSKEMARRYEAWDLLYEKGLEARLGRDRRFSADLLEKILALITEHGLEER